MSGECSKLSGILSGAHLEILAVRLAFLSPLLLLALVYHLYLCGLFGFGSLLPVYFLYGA